MGSCKTQYWARPWSWWAASEPGKLRSRYKELQALCWVFASLLSVTDSSHFKYFFMHRTNRRSPTFMNLKETFVVIIVEFPSVARGMSLWELMRCLWGSWGSCWENLLSHCPSCLRSCGCLVKFHWVEKWKHSSFFKAWLKDLGSDMAVRLTLLIGTGSSEEQGPRSKSQQCRIIQWMVEWLQALHCDWKKLYSSPLHIHSQNILNWKEPHKKFWVQLLAPVRSTQNPNPVSGSIVQMFLELQQLGALSTACRA